MLGLFFFYDFLVIKYTLMSQVHMTDLMSKTKTEATNSAANDRDGVS